MSRVKLNDRTVSFGEKPIVNIPNKFNEFKHLLNNLTVPQTSILLFLSFVSGFFAVKMAVNSNPNSIILFVLAAIFLKMCGIRKNEVPDLSESIKFERIIAVVLFLLLFIIRIATLGNYPPGAIGWEAGHALGADALKKIGFTPYFGNPELSWSTAIFYQTLPLMDVFGWHIQFIRMPSAFIGFLSVISFYFLIRKTASNTAALVSAAAYGVCSLHLLISSWAFPGSYLFFSLVIAVYFFVLFIEKESLLFASLSGISAAISMHGYTPGRIVPFIFLAGMLLYFVFNFRKINTKYMVGIGIFWLSFVIFTLPIIFFAFKNPDVYWGYMKGHSVINEMDVLKQVWYGIQTAVNSGYLGIFHVSADWDASVHIPGKPIIDIIIGFMFPIGLILAFFNLKKPENILMILILVLGIVPAAAASQRIAMHPTVRRVILVLPAVYFFSALYLNEVLFVLKKRLRINFKLLLILLFVSVSVYFVLSLKVHFVDFLGSMEAKNEYNHKYYLMGKDMADYKKFRVYNERSFADNVAAVPLLPRPSDKFIYSAENVLSAEFVDSLFYFEGYAEGIADLFNTVYKDAVMKVFSEEKTVKTVNPWLEGKYWQGRSLDPFNPAVYLVRLKITSEQMESIKGKFFNNQNLFLNCNENGEDDSVAEEPGILSAGFFLENDMKLKFDFQDSVEVFKFDGKKFKSGAVIDAVYGYHILSVSPKTNTEFTGSGPVSVSRWDGKAWILFNYFAVPKTGMKFDFFDKEDKNISTEIKMYPSARFYHRAEAAKCTGISTLAPKQSGDYVFYSAKPGICRIFIDGQLIFSNWNENISRTVSLKNCKNYSIKIDYKLSQPNDKLRTMMIMMAEADGSKPVPVPYDWFYLNM